MHFTIKGKKNLLDAVKTANSLSLAIPETDSEISITKKVGRKLLESQPEDFWIGSQCSVGFGEDTKTFLCLLKDIWK